ncbi:MAG: hypothetical protein AAGG75_05065 [Bacteroidota bacterium]
MRIIGSIDHPVMKITVFKMDNKLSVKFETGLYEQIYKFRTGDSINTLEDMQQLVDEPFINSVLAEMTTLHQIKSQALSRLLPEEEEDFDQII